MLHGRSDVHRARSSPDTLIESSVDGRPQTLSQQQCRRVLISPSTHAHRRQEHKLCATGACTTHTLLCVVSMHSFLHSAITSLGSVGRQNSTTKDHRNQFRCIAYSIMQPPSQEQTRSHRLGASRRAGKLRNRRDQLRGRAAGSFRHAPLRLRVRAKVVRLVCRL